ncbi:hypothetical protein URH17368_1237 [Alicyclobacillus hesperidum URH17-3-68]|nr:hypothetical protein URH17368_1237 [Alicyclobacillus hesperidum URH17-3-68]
MQDCQFIKQLLAGRRKVYQDAALIRRIPLPFHQTKLLAPLDQPKATVVTQL